MTQTSATIAAFSKDAAQYDRVRKGLIPCYDSLYGTVVESLGVAALPDSPRILELGAGTGVLAEYIRASWPNARLHLLDGSEAMLAGARARFVGDAGVSFEIGDMQDIGLTALRAGPWDAIVSALAIHHLEHEGKRALFSRILEALVPGGWFINAEQVLAPTVTAQMHYEAIWRRQARDRGVSEAELAQADARMAHDRCASVEDQLLWLRETGFVEVDCPFKAWRFAVLRGRKAERSAAKGRAA
jgi:trans-aconitate methyltransferase